MINVTIEKDPENFDLQTIKFQYNIKDIITTSEQILMKEVLGTVSKELSKDILDHYRKVFTKEKLAEVLIEAIRKELSNDK